MERHKSVSCTPENYARAIISLSKRYSSTSAFPGNNYVDLAAWLLQDRGLFNPAKLKEDIVPVASTSETPHHLVVVYNTTEKKWCVQAYNQDQHQDFYSTPSAQAGGLGQLVFIRGFISPAWMSVLGSRYNIDPEFFRRHMDFLSASIDRHAFSFPSLASSSDNIFRLCVSTLLHRDDFGGQDLQSQRASQAIELGAYRVQQLNSGKTCCGDSLVREYSTVCSRFSVVEQWISLYVTKAHGDWTVIAWMDHGRPLEKSPPGPWTSHIESKATSLPILQCHHKMAFRNTVNRLDPDENASADVPQTTAILPLQYDSVLALANLARRAPQDPLSMCIPLFAHAAFSEVQFLNLMESKIQSLMNAMDEGVPPDALGTFQYFSNILHRHAQQLKDSTRALCRLAERSNQGLNGTKAESSLSINNPPIGISTSLRCQTPDSTVFKLDGSSAWDGAFTSKSLLEDYNLLCIRCVDLSKMCTRGITLAMGKASIEESRKVIEQSQRLKRLTILATLFIPLSFTTSLFGMNVDLLGQSTVKFWWFLVLCIPITVFAYICYLWNSQGLMQWFATSWKWFVDTRQILTTKSSEKDPAYVV